MATNATSRTRTSRLRAKLEIQNGRNKTQNARDKKLVDLLFIKMDMRAPCVLFAYFIAPGGEKEETGDWLLSCQSHSSIAPLICEARRFPQQTISLTILCSPIFRRCSTMGSLEMHVNFPNGEVNQLTAEQFQCINHRRPKREIRINN